MRPINVIITLLLLLLLLLLLHRVSEKNCASVIF